MFERALYFTVIESPVGKIRLLATDRGLSGVFFEEGKHGAMRFDAQEAKDHPVLLKAQKQLAEYFAGKRRDFDLPLDMTGGTVFQQKAWKELQKIPYATTISYGEQAKRVGDAKKARAVGVANGRNPLSIVVPCHRVIGASGSLTGFGGGIKTKEYLLTLEKRCA